MKSGVGAAREGAFAPRREKTHQSLRRRLPWACRETGENRPLHPAVIHQPTIIHHPLKMCIRDRYQVEAYLPRCLESICAQTLQDFELILVDDGTKDGCPRIMDEYAARDPRIRILHKENGGLSSARNAGLDAARGEYVAFIDSDDYADPDLSLIHIFCQRSMAPAFAASPWVR